MNTPTHDTAAALAATLLPCPFCGSKAPTFERLGTPRQSCIVVCGDCGCRHESSDEGARNGTSWNTRTALAPQPAPQGAEPVPEMGNCCYGGPVKPRACWSCALWKPAAAPGAGLAGSEGAAERQALERAAKWRNLSAAPQQVAAEAPWLDFDAAHKS